jgi:hypothetical protein
MLDAAQIEVLSKFALFERMSTEAVAPGKSNGVGQGNK